MVEVSERILYEQINAYLEEHDKLCKHQSRFRAINSTDIAVLEATDSWAYNIDFGKINAVIFVDLKKALDTVDHNILLSKLDPYGISGNLLNGCCRIWRTAQDNAQLVGPYLTVGY